MPPEYVGTPWRSSTTTGVGTGMMPWSVRTMPMPVGMAEAKTRSTPRSSSAVATPTNSTRQSRSPNSWKVMRSGSLPETVAAACARRWYMRSAIRRTVGGRSDPSSSSRMLAYVRITDRGAVWTCSRTAESPRNSTASARSSASSRGNDPRAAVMAGSSAPASISAASAMSPEMPEKQSK